MMPAVRPRHVFLACYLVAAIPSGFLLVKLMTGKDVRDAGSGIIGAPNVARGRREVGGVTCPIRS